MISLDTETTGLDFHHGCKPFFVTTCDEDGLQRFWDWPVDPLTRQPDIPKGDLGEVRDLVMSAPGVGGIVLHNAEFDVQALSAVIPSLADEWPWDYTHDTLVAGHLLASNQRHDLTFMAWHYMGLDIKVYEEALEKAVQECRRYCRSYRPTWLIAREGLPTLPSTGGGTKVWMADFWLPSVLSRLGVDPDGTYESALRDYSNADSAATLALWCGHGNWHGMRHEVEARGQHALYEEKKRWTPIALGMQDYGLHLNRGRMREQRTVYGQEAARMLAECVAVARSRGYALTMPRSGNNHSLTDFCFSSESDHGLGLPVVKRSKKTHAPSLDKECLDTYEATLHAESDQLRFVQALSGVRKRGTAVAYLEDYERFMLPYGGDNGTGRPADRGWYVLHPHINPTGTDTLRWSFSNPNSANISKREGFNLRRCFGPAPGREWWSLDAKNLELRIPAYEAGERDVVEVFEHPDDPPYFGSYHLLVCDLLHPALFKKHPGLEFKELFEATWYQWVKNGNFLIIYGGQEDLADRTYHVPGAFKKVKHRFPNIAALSDRMMRMAERMGYVETVPDLSLDWGGDKPRGYPLLCTRTDRGRVLPTVPLNYHVSGTAMWWMGRAMVRCEAKIKEWRSRGFDAHITAQVHDELVFDFPKGGNPKTDAEQEKGCRKEAMFRTRNLCRARVLQGLMEQGGKDIGVPTPVNVKYVDVSWDKGLSF